MSLVVQVVWEPSKREFRSSSLESDAFVTQLYGFPHPVVLHSSGRGGGLTVRGLAEAGKQGRVTVGRRLVESSARERELLETIEQLHVRLREVHHRVRRQLQTISSLLSMQAERSRDERVSRALAEAATRILTIATIDDQLRSQTATAAVDMVGAIRAIGDLAQTMLGTAVPPVTVTYHLDPFSLPSDLAVQCGLVINELLTNALQHGFKGRSDGRVEVRAGVGDGRVLLVVQDDGIGPTQDAASGETAGLGLDLIRLLVARQLHGEFGIDAANGTRCSVSFPYPTGPS